MVRTNTLVLPGHGRRRRAHQGHRRAALAMSVDGNGRYCYLDPYRGAQLAVAEAARNVACAGARADRRDQLPQFRQPGAARDHVAVRARRCEGIGAACRALDIPITGGNVSLYNETDGSAIYPTPVLGVVGLIEDADRVSAAARSSAAGDVIVLLGDGTGELGGSEYLKVDARAGPRRCRRRSIWRPSARCSGCSWTARRDGLIRSAHDCSDGGLAVDAGRVLLRHRRHRRRRSIVPPVAAPAAASDIAATLFGESASRVVVSVGAATVRSAAGAWPRRPACRRAAIGQTGGDRIRMSRRRRAGRSTSRSATPSGVWATAHRAASS